MCQQQMPVNQANKSSSKNNNNNNNSSNKMKHPTYSIKKVLKAFFKKQQKHQPSSGQLLSNSMESLESLENYRNMQTEQQQFYIEIDENSANEKIAEIVQDEINVYVPVRFARTEAGTFFWTTNLQPVTSSIIPTAGDEDLVQPAYCYSTHQYPLVQYQDRWAQA